MLTAPFTLDTAGALGTPEELDLDNLSPNELEEVAAPWPVHWLFAPQPGDPDRVVNLFAGPGGWDAGVRDVLQHDLDVVGVEVHKDASATARAAGFKRIVADVRTLDPKHPALRWVRGLLVSAPCQCWTPAGKRAGQDPRNQELLLDVFTAAFEATFGHWHESRPCEWEGDCLVCDDPEWDGYAGFTGPLLTLDEVRAPIAEMTDERIGLLAEVLIWSLTLTAQWDNLRWLAMEQSSALPETILDGIREELWSADWCSAEYRVLDAVDYGLASRRKRVFLMAARHSYVDMAALIPQEPLPTTTAAEALGWPAGIRVNTRGVRKTAGGNCWSADKPATGITSKIRGWYWEHDKDRKFNLDEAALLVGFAPGYPWTGSRSSCTQQIGDVVAPPMGCVVIGSLLKEPWEHKLRIHLSKIYGHPADASPKESHMDSTNTTEVETEYGKVTVRRVASDTAPKDKRDWTISYEVTGPRMKGLVHIQPQFRTDDFEVLPSQVAVMMSSNRYSETHAEFTVNGVELDDTQLFHIAEPSDAQRFDFWRRTGEHRRSELSDAGTARTRAGLRAVLETHFADELLVHDQATAYARARHRSRTFDTRRSLDAKIAEAEELEQTIEGIRHRLGLLGDLEEIAAAQRPAGPPEDAPEDTPGDVVELKSEPESGEVPIAELRAGEEVRATGNNTMGRTVTRVGVLLVEPKQVTVQDWGRRVTKWRLYIDEPGSAPTRSNSVTLWPHETAERLGAPARELATAA
ncbi:hypothetical protein AQI95_09670 [Streptomyces yokosukanensis]|uniref:Uncharacterized protein n=1 Tax=Streptomyces yokosukanensis TaxID=67386 RepID=A0A101PBU3_9ACTN|nr:DNA cytosine methyltransferase [Streptomyces yokosukanensis]KUN08610.1 hypothetical protein AQI95_09670 [Streptomyces yokosukanensis]